MAVPTVDGVATSELVMAAASGEAVVRATATFSTYDIKTAGEAVVNPVDDTESITMGGSVTLKASTGNKFTSVYVVGLAASTNTNGKVVSTGETDQPTIRGELTKFDFSPTNNVRTVTVSLEPQTSNHNQALFRIRGLLMDVDVTIFENVLGVGDLYYPIHQGVTGDPATEATIPDHSNVLPLILAVPNDATQWDVTNGDFVCPALNSQYAAYAIADSGNLSNYQQFSLAGNYCLMGMRLRATASATSTGRLVSLFSSGTQVFDVRQQSGSTRLQLFFSNTQYGNTDLSLLSGDEGLLFVHVDLRDSGSKTVTTWLYNLTSYEIAGGSPNSISFDGSQIADYTAQIGDQFTIGARDSSGGLTNFANNISVSEFRWINFGTNPPSDLTEKVEELAARRLQGVERA